MQHKLRSWLMLMLCMLSVQHPSSCHCKVRRRVYSGNKGDVTEVTGSVLYRDCGLACTLMLLKSLGVTCLDMASLRSLCSTTRYFQCLCACLHLII